MKLLSLIALVPLTAALFVPGPKNLKGQALADYINSRQSLWKAESPKISLTSVKKRLMDVKYTKHPEGVKMLEAHTLPNAADDIPDEFDARTQWPQCQSISTIRDQSDCGSCWAFAGTEVMSDRICIATNGEKQIYVSDDDLLSCCGKTCGDGCDGGWPIEAFNYWKNTGIVSGGRYGSKDGCRPYELSPCGGDSPYGECPDNGYDTPKCKKQCQKGYDKSYNADKTHGKTSYAVPGAVATVQREIMARGPVEVAFTVYEDFYSYKSGIYSHTWGDALGGHAVRILGWGVENAIPYWLVANSWSETWGENGGYFRIVRGTNECGIEGAIVAGEYLAQ